MFCRQAPFEGWTFATVVRQYLTFQRQKWPSEKAKMICFGPVSNLWNDAQLPAVSDAVSGEETLCWRKAHCFPSVCYSLFDFADSRHCIPWYSSLPLSGASPGHPGGQSLHFFFQEDIKRKISLRNNSFYLQNTHGSLQKNIPTVIWEIFLVKSFYQRDHIPPVTSL